jgi:flagellar P-ring protein precursor FlgI
MKHFWKLFLLVSLGYNIHAHSTSRIKDIASFEGVRENVLIGYGLVVGLGGTGDNLKNSTITEKMLVDLLEKHGTNIFGADLKTRNIAAVTVVANLPPFARLGSKINIRVSAIGDAKSLKGGSLLPVELIAADGKAYAVAQGLISVPEFSPVSDDVKNRTNSITTNAIVQGGAIIEREVPFNYEDLQEMKMGLYNPDASTASKIAQVINDYTDSQSAKAIDPGTVVMQIPSYRKKDIVDFIAEIEKLQIDPDYKAKIVVNEATGTIVMGNNVVIRPVAIAQGNILISVGADKAKYIENLPFKTSANQDKAQVALNKIRGDGMGHLDKGASLNDLVTGLNKLKVYPRDIIDILRSIKAAGAMDAEIEIH